MKIRLTVRNPACLSRTEEAPSPFQLPQADLKWDLDEKYPQSKSVEINVVGFSPRTEELRFQSGPCLWDNETTGVYCPYTASGISLSCIFVFPHPSPWYPCVCGGYFFLYPDAIIKIFISSWMCVISIMNSQSGVIWYIKNKLNKD